MKNHFRNSLEQLLLATSVTALMASTAIAAPMYSITAVADRGGYLSEANDINNNSQVVGYGPTARGSSNALLWDSVNGITILENFPSYGDGIAYAINDSGQVVGKSDIFTNHRYTRPALWDGRDITDLGDLPGGNGSGYAYGINESGQVVGYSNSSGSFRAFLWDSVRGMTQLADLPGAGDLAVAYAINDSGQVVGRGYTTHNGFGVLSAALWQGGSVTDLGVLGGSGGNSTAYAINNSGQVVGSSYAAYDPSRGHIIYHSFLWDSVNGMRDLGALPGDNNATALDINDSGQVVGVSSNPYVDTYTSQRPFLWDDGEMFDLNTLVVNPGDWILRQARAINDSGQIVGIGDFGSVGSQRAFLLTPVPGTDAAFPLLPTEDDTPESFDFTFTVTDPDAPVFIDPLIAIGYDYIINSGPNAASVILPTLALDDGLYQIYLWDGDGFDILDGIASAGVQYFFDTGGIDRFRVLGIDAAALLNPADTLAFVTGLTYVAAGEVSISQIPVTFDTDPPSTGVPEPVTLSLLGAGLAGIGVMRRRRA